MKRLKTLLALFTLLFTPHFGLALGPWESMTMQVTKLVDATTIITERGAEDDIRPWDHVAIMMPDKFIARAVCLRAGKKNSIWHLYRLERAALIKPGHYFEIIHTPERSLTPKLRRQILLKQRQIQQMF